MHTLTVLAAGFLSTLAIASPVSAATCESVASMTLPGTAFTMAKMVPAGAFAPPSGEAGRGGRIRDASGALVDASFANLPAFCRVAATLAPSSDSDIKVEVWLPAANWNGKYLAVGNGGWAGAISYIAMADALKRGYATSSTDTGHVGARGNFALGHPEKLTDFAYRAVHEMTITAKAAIDAFYGQRPRLSYWNGCSTGGRQGLKEAQRFPDDYDGIVAGAPANNWTRLTAHQVAIMQASQNLGGIEESKFPLIHEAVLRACDASDGVVDGVLENPATCKFDPIVLRCKGPDGPSCLTAREVELAQSVYAASINPRTREVVHPGLMPGTELRWVQHIGLNSPQISPEYFKYVVFQDPNWTAQSFDLGVDVARADNIDSGLIAATDPNLKPFFARGGKLLHYHGWSDPQISPLNSVNYYDSVTKLVPKDTLAASYRLFMVPGMAHCGGGEGPTSFDPITALERWVEDRVAPDSVAASRIVDGKADRTRPLCPYPLVARYKGTGSTDNAQNFSCAKS
jgi:feruloyl esterase